jgi:hypothetical protein
MGRRANVETGAEVDEDSSRQTLSEYISILKGRWTMKNTYSSKCHMLPHKMEIDLHMLGPLVMNWIR